MPVVIAYVYPWVVFIHVASAFGFFLVHGAAAMMSLRLPHERKLERIRALLDLSSSTNRMLQVTGLTLLLSGIVAASMGHWWSKGWIWLSLLLIVVISFWMGRFIRVGYNILRKAVGLPYFEMGKGMQPPAEPVSEAQIAAIFQRARPERLALISYGVVLVIVWLMMFKPF